jgi:tetratricopeptide (TPR) repeat protein
MTLQSPGRRHRDGGPVERTADQRLATLHLRTGSLSLARAELETMAGDGLLDAEALIDLAEVRWRTGDLPGAGEAADAYLEAGHETTIGLVIAAEAHAGLGRPNEARRLADRAIQRADRSLDGIFAGLPRSSIWPRVAGTEALAQPDSSGPAGAATGRRGPASGSAPTPTPGDTGQPPASRAGHVPDGSRALRAAEEAIAAGDPPSAAVQLALALRASPALAPAVLDLARDQNGAAFDVIRGDAFRLVGREAEARRSFAAAAARRPDVEDPPAPDPDPEVAVAAEPGEADRGPIA